MIADILPINFELKIVFVYLWNISWQFYGKFKSPFCGIPA